MTAHGTVRAYNNGCRCAECAQARADWLTGYQARRLTVLPCGLRATYDAGCRCDLCREAKRASRVRPA